MGFKMAYMRTCIHTYEYKYRYKYTYIYTQLYTHIYIYINNNIAILVLPLLLDAVAFSNGK